MSKAEVAKNQPDDGDGRTSLQPQISRVTLLLGRHLNGRDRFSQPRCGCGARNALVPNTGILLLMYVATCLVTLFSFKREPWVGLADAALSSAHRHRGPLCSANGGNSGPRAKGSS